MREAAALPLVFITAWEGLVDRAGVKTGQKVLVRFCPKHAQCVDSTTDA